MQDVAEILKEEQLLKDPYWKSIFESDLRNIFPKYELAKIECAKNRVAKTRLIMEHIEQFMTMEICKKELQANIKSAEDNELASQLNQIQAQPSFSHYDLDILTKKATVQKLAYELAKPSLNNQLKQQLLKHQKWGPYIQKHVQPPIKFQQQLLNIAKIQLAEAIELGQSLYKKTGNNTQPLLCGTQALIIEQRIRNRQLGKKMVDVWKKGTKDDISLQASWKKDWEKMAKGFQPAQF